MTSYLSENATEILQNGDVHLTQIPDFEMEISRTIWRIEVGDGSFLCIFHTLSFELNFFFDRRFPLRYLYTVVNYSAVFPVSSKTLGISKNLSSSLPFDKVFPPLSKF